MADIQSLNKFISILILIYVSVNWALLQECNGDASWTSFALCTSCTNTRLVVPGNFFEQRLIRKGSSLISARIDCSHSCVNQGSCYAFNFYENENFYVCELLSDNFRRNKTVLQLIAQPGCSVWEKLSIDPNSRTTVPSTEATSAVSTAMADSNTGMSTKISAAMSSTEMSPATTAATSRMNNSMTSPTTNSTPKPCSVVRPGCLGTFPNCYSCIKTCREAVSRADISGPDVTLWPDGDGLDSVPIPAKCVYDSVVLIERIINLSAKTQQTNYAISFNDMHRLVRLNVYRHLTISFFTKDLANGLSPNQFDRSDYANVFISPNGTLSNLTYAPISGATTLDFFGLQGQPMKPTPFVNVTDDRFSCGSFWLLDAANATYCPGGKAGMFGYMRANGYVVQNTGIRIPTKPNAFTYSVQMVLI